MIAAPEHWVFGYGSLMWRPGFKFLQSCAARLEGFHRSLCVRSHIYRGTAEVPGAVMALRRGGACDGVAFEVADEVWPGTLDYLRKRELVTNVYIERQLPVQLIGHDKDVEAITYVVDEDHDQFLGEMTREEILVLVRQGVGQAGRCDDYVRNTAAELRSLGLSDPYVDEIIDSL